jgi:transposase InsO family protein
LRLEFVKEHQNRWPIKVLCRTLEVTRAAFYKWLGRKSSATQEKQSLIVSEARRIHALPRHQDYGSPRMHCELVNQGINCSENTVAKLMRENQIQARRKPKFKISTTDSKHDSPIATNRLNQQFAVSKINQVWLTDFTYIPTSEGFSYLCAFKDLCSRRIVGWAMSRNIDAQLAISAFNQAVALREPPAGLIVHSDRGSQFASNAFRKRLEDCKCVQSMSRKGNCYDNAPMESFFKTFKSEEVYHEKYETHEQAVRAANDYIERFYNPIRLHSTLDYLSPLEFEQRLLLKSEAARNLPLWVD